VTEMNLKTKMAYLFIGLLIGIVTACLGLEARFSNHMGWVLLASAIGFCATASILLGILFIVYPAPRQLNDGSLWISAFGFMIITLVTPLEYLFWTPLLPRSDLTQDIGLILFLAGICVYLLFPGKLIPGNDGDAQHINQNFNPFQSDSFTGKIFPFHASLLLLTTGLCIGFSSLVGLIMEFLWVFPGLGIKMWRISKHL
jgi:hypothetical protein